MARFRKRRGIRGKKRRIGRRTRRGFRGRGKGRFRAKKSFIGRLIWQKIAQPHEIREVLGQSCFCAVGQKAWALGYIGSVPEINKCEKKRPITNISTFEEGGSIQAGTGQNMSKMRVKAVSVVRMINRDSTPSHVTVYKWVARKDVLPSEFPDPSVPGSHNNINLKGLLNKFYLEFNSTLVTRDTFAPTLPSSIYNGATTLTAPYLINYTPFMSPTFCHFFKIISVKQAVLGPGQSAHFMYGSKKYKTYTNWDLRSTDGTSAPGNDSTKNYPVFLGGRTSGYLISVIGAPVHLDQNKAIAPDTANQTYQSTGATGIDINESKTYNYYFIDKVHKSFDFRFPQDNGNVAYSTDKVTSQMIYDSANNQDPIPTNWSNATDLALNPNTWSNPVSAVVKTVSTMDYPSEP